MPYLTSHSLCTPRLVLNLWFSSLPSKELRLQVRATRPSYWSNSSLKSSMWETEKEFSSLITFKNLKFYPDFFKYKLTNYRTNQNLYFRHILFNIGAKYPMFEKLLLWAGEIAQRVKARASQALWPHFCSWSPQKGRRRETTPQRCLLTSTCAPWHTPTKIINKQVKKKHKSCC